MAFNWARTILIMSDKFKDTFMDALLDKLLKISSFSSWVFILKYFGILIFREIIIGYICQYIIYIL